MRWLINIVIAFIAYQFGRWVKQADLVVAHFNDRNEIERLRAEIAEMNGEIAELRETIRKLNTEKEEAVFQ